MSRVEPGIKLGNELPIKAEMRGGFVNNIGTMKHIVTRAVVDIIKPEMAYIRIVC